MTAAEMIQRYAEIRARLMGKAEPVVIKRAMLIPPPTQEPTRTFKPAYKQRDFLEVMGIEPSKPIGWRAILNEVASKHGTSAEKLISKAGEKAICRARQEAMWRMRNESRMSLPAIGYKLGGRHHATIIDGIKRHEARSVAS